MALQPKPFSLDVVLDYRKRLEDVAKNRFFEAKQVHTAVKMKLLEEGQNLSALLNECEQLQSIGVEITKLILFEEKITATKKNLTAIEKNLADKKKLVDQAQKTLLTRTRDYQAMERLKNEQNRSWTHYLDKKEAAMLDEIAVMRHGKSPLDK